MTFECGVWFTHLQEADYTRSLGPFAKGADYRNLPNVGGGAEVEDGNQPIY